MSEAETRDEAAEAEAAEDTVSAEAPEPELSPEEARVLELERERDEYLDLAQRARAEFDNFRKRTARDVGEAEQRGKVNVARALLPSLDNLERALLSVGVPIDSRGDADLAGPGREAEEPASREISAHEALAAGVALVHGEMVGALRSSGIESFDPVGERFDPVRHEALSARPAGDDEEAGQVAETLQRGYALGEVLIRPARVVVTQ